MKHGTSNVRNLLAKPGHAALRKWLYDSKPLRTQERGVCDRTTNHQEAKENENIPI